MAQEVVRIAEGALLFASDFSPADRQLLHQQVIKDSDWVHIQFRIQGGGHERVSTRDVVETPDQSCVVVRYPQNSVVDRAIHVADSFRAACLLLRPRAITELLDTSVARLPEQTQWIAREESLQLHVTVLPLSSAMQLAVNDILSCPFRRTARRAYMRAKALELLSSVVHGLDHSAPTSHAGGVRLTRLDLEKLDQARRVMSQELDSAMTLATLARRIGLNRTKLAFGFKELYGISVQAYWRDQRLSRARELLQAGEVPVTEVALSSGYSELSSFTRAFSRKFGLVPRSVRARKK